MPRRAKNAERLILIINRRVRRFGGWNVAVLMAAISLGHRQGRRLSIEAISRQTDLSVGIVHRHLRALKVAGIVESVGPRKNYTRRLTSKGRSKIRRLCDLTFTK